MNTLAKRKPLNYTQRSAAESVCRRPGYNFVDSERVKYS
jgi:hypothetical protein